MMQATQPVRALSSRGRAGNTTALAGAHVLRALARTDITNTRGQHHQASSCISTSTAMTVAVRSAARSARCGPTSITLPCSSLARTSRRMSFIPRLEHTWWQGGSRARSGNLDLPPRPTPSTGRLTTATRSVSVGRVSSGRGERGAGAAAIARCTGSDMSKRNMSSTTMSERDFHTVADEALEDIHDAVEEALEEGFPEDFDCNMSQGVLNIVVGDRGTWVLNKQSPNRQIWWSSPVSGPMRFEYHEETKRWLNTRDGETELQPILATEMRDKCGVSL